MSLAVKILRIVALPLERGGHRGATGFPLAVAQPLVVAEEKCLVALDRTAHRTAKLVALQRFHVRRKKAFCIHRVIAQEFPYGAMKRIGARARDNVGG